MNLHFLVVGALFFWPIIGIDPAPRRLPPVARLGVVFASVPFHAFFGVALMSGKTVIGGRLLPHPRPCPGCPTCCGTSSSAVAWRGRRGSFRCSSS